MFCINPLKYDLFLYEWNNHNPIIIQYPIILSAILASCGKDFRNNIKGGNEHLRVVTYFSITRKSNIIHKIIFPNSARGQTFFSPNIVKYQNSNTVKVF